MNKEISTQIYVQLNDRNRLTAFFRLILLIPVSIYASSFATSMGNNRGGDWFLAGLFTIPVGLAIVVRGIYPSYALAMNQSLLGLNTRIMVYALLLRDEYPSIEDSQFVSLSFPDIEGGKNLSRWAPLVKWFLALPLYFIGVIYLVYALMLSLVAWATVILSGKYPEWCAQGVTGTISYWNRVNGYAWILVTDEYPSFSL